jgi:tetratricopeptide (TPR) repeat protein
LPVEEARRFLNAPVEIGNQAPAAPVAAAKPEEIEQRYTAAVEAFRAGRYAEAADGFAWVVANDPGGPDAGPSQWNLIRSRLRSGDANGAMDALDGLLRHYGDYLGDQSADLHAGLQAMEQNDLQAALALLEKMVGEDPDNELVPLAYALIARIHWAYGEPFKMVRAFARMFGSVKDDVPAYKTLAGALDRYASGDTKVTQTFRELAEHGDEGFRDIYHYLEARSLLERDQFGPTKESLEQLRRLHPDGDFTHIVDLEHAWNLLRHGQAAEALAIFERLEQEPAPQSAQAFDAFFDLRAELPMGVARCHLALGQYEEAAAAFQRALAANPRSVYDVSNRLNLALAYEGLGQYDKAVEVLQAVIRDHPDDPRLWALQQQLARIEERKAER